MVDMFGFQLNLPNKVLNLSGKNIGIEVYLIKNK